MKEIVRTIRNASVHQAKPSSVRPTYTNGENIEYSTNGSTGQREKAPAEPVCLITLNKEVE